MTYDLTKCPECGYVNKSEPDVCPSCGYDLKEYRYEMRAKMRAEALETAKKEEQEQIELTYKEAIGLFNDGLYQDARNTFMSLGDYKDSEAFAEKCKEGLYQALIEEFNKNEFLANLVTKEFECDYFKDRFAIHCRGEYKVNSFKKIKTIFEPYKNYKKANEYIAYCDEAIELYALYKKQEAEYNEYYRASDLYDDGKFEEAMVIFQELKDAKIMGAGKRAIQSPKTFITKCIDGMYKRAVQTFEAGHYEKALKEFKKVQEYKDVSDWLSRTQIEVDRIEKEREIKKAKQAELNAAKAAIQLAKDTKDRKVNVLVYSLSLIICLVIGIILLINKEQISIVSSFGWWLFGWIVLAAAAIFTSGIHLSDSLKHAPSADIVSHKKVAKTVAIATVVVSIISGILFSTLDFGFKPTECVKITAIDKEDSIGGKSYDTVITFNLENTSKIDVKYIKGEMLFYNGETKVATYNVYFEGAYNANESSETTVELSGYKDSSLYDVSFENLKITYRVTSMRFDGDYTEREYKGKAITIKEPN